MVNINYKISQTIRLLVIFVMLLTLIIPDILAVTEQTVTYDTALVYYNEACSMCSL